ncbi:MAG: ABC transporter ATP-binding protein [Hyphomicrobiales bacterium]|nr:ABC transporter ATP-binding protein [Hyphomicrobiales bacterium]
MSEPLLEVDRLGVEFVTRHGDLRALDGVSFSMAQGEILGLVGESGAGKSLTGRAIIGLIDQPGRICGGTITFEGRRIDNLRSADLRKLRGKRIGTIFQDPLTSLDPLQRIGDQLVETIRAHLPLNAAQAREKAIALLGEVGLPAAADRMRAWPHEFSGGMRQRVVIALALACDPSLLIADEPTTALDVSVQAQIIALLRRLARAHNASVLLVTHDMGVIAEAADRVAVMYAGRVVEIGPVADVIARPWHPYSRGLMGSIPSLREEVDRLTQIPGAMPRIGARPEGCAYAPRCPKAEPRCRMAAPPMIEAGPRAAACIVEPAP